MHSGSIRFPWARMQSNALTRAIHKDLSRAIQRIDVDILRFEFFNLSGSSVMIPDN